MFLFFYYGQPGGPVTLRILIEVGPAICSRLTVMRTPFRSKLSFLAVMTK